MSEQKKSNKRIQSTHRDVVRDADALEAVAGAEQRSAERHALKGGNRAAREPLLFRLRDASRRGAESNERALRLGARPRRLAQRERPVERVERFRRRSGVDGYSAAAAARRGSGAPSAAGAGSALRSVARGGGAATRRLRRRTARRRQRC